VWEARFETEDQARAELDALKSQRLKLAGAVAVSLDAARDLLQRSGREDRWVDISAADYLFLTSGRTSRVAFAYQSALKDAPDFFFDSVRTQLEMFQRLGVLSENTGAAMTVVRPASPQVSTPKLGRVILFSGHMIDPSRFPEALKSRAKEAILEKMRQEIGRTEDSVVAIASAANGGDLLFHDVCDELAIPHNPYLPLSPDLFRSQSVSPAGRFWEDRFDALLKKYPSPHILAERPELPLWLSARTDYSNWQRANLWLIHEVLALHARNVSLLTLWDGVKTERLGGTYHLRTLAQQYGAALVTIYTADLREDASAAG
jgi:hypothetical protein